MVTVEDSSAVRAASPRSAGTVTVAEFALVQHGGIVQAGRAEVDESAVTGAVTPVLKQPGDRILAGSRNGAEVLEIIPDPAAMPDRPPIPSAGAIRHPAGVDLVGPFLRPLFRRLMMIAIACLAAAVLRLVSDGRPVTVEALAMILVGLISPGLFLVWPAQRLALRQWLNGHRLHCPDLDRLHGLLRVRRVIFGRHGTLSEGHLRIVSLQPCPEITPAEMVVLCASAYQLTEDVWGKALMAFGISHRVHLRPAERVRVEPGLGLSARVDDKTVLVGRAAWLEQQDVAITGLDEPLAEYRRLGREMMFVGLAAPEPRCLGVIALADPPRRGTSILMRTCKQSGLETVLIGDRTDAATATLAGLTGVGDLVSSDQASRFDDETSMIIARASDRAVLVPYDNAIGLGEMAVKELAALPFGIRRNDTRHVLDFMVLAQVLSRRLPLTLILVWMTGWPLVLDGLGLFALPPLLRLACLALGIIVAIFMSQLLRLVDSLANDEHED